MNPRAAVVKGKLKQVSIFDLHESGKNDLLYRPAKRDDPDIQGLADSIKSNGLLEPIIITKDDYIVSGHRRRLACEMAGLFKIPCEILPIFSDDPKFLKSLRECNRQRVKGFDELIREAVVDATGEREEIARNLRIERMVRSSIDIDPMNIIGIKSRAAVKGNRPLLDAAAMVIHELKQFWPLSVRQVHYRLLNDPPLKHINKPDSTYMNDRPSYQVLCDVLTRGRLSGEISWEVIGDETRPIVVWNVQKNIDPFIKNQFDRFMKGYARDYMQSQPNHIEIVGEKLTIESIIRPVAMKFCIPYTIGRGYSSINPRHDMADRFWKSGKEKLIVLILSDHDPDGVEIAQSFARSMRDDFGIDIHPVRVALTNDQVLGLNLHPNREVNENSRNYPKFVEKYGRNVFELEAVSPEKLQQFLTEAIQDSIDTELFNLEMEQEEKEFLHLAEYRKKVLETMRSPS